MTYSVSGLKAVVSSGDFDFMWQKHRNAHDLYRCIITWNDRFLNFDAQTTI